MKMTKKIWRTEVIPLYTTTEYKALDKLINKMLRRIDKVCAVKKSDIGKGDIKSGVEHSYEGRG